jgi:RNA polymerase sigma-70 factor (ECF subfamily)
MNQSDLTAETTNLRTYLLALAGRIAGYEQAEDVVQDGIVSAFEYFVTHPDAEIHNPKAWLASLVRNRAIDVRRHDNIKSRVHGQILAESVTDYDPRDTLNDALDAKRIVREAGLESDEIYIVEQVYLTGRTYDELADELDISVSTVKRRVKSARAKLATAKENN